MIKQDLLVHATVISFHFFEIFFIPELSLIDLSIVCGFAGIYSVLILTVLHLDDTTFSD